MSQDFWRLVATHKQLVLMFGHQLGGGGDAARQTSIKAYLNAGFSILSVESIHAKKSESVECKLLSSDKMHLSESYLAIEIFQFLKKQSYVIVDIDTLVSFKPAVMFIRKFSLFIQQVQCQKVFASVHDYYAICPSHNLLGSDGQYCQAPAEDKCEPCRKQHTNTMLHEQGAHLWRSYWQKIFQVCDEIRVYSTSSAHLITSIFPQHQKKLVIKPHGVPRISAPSLMPQTKTNGNNITVGVLGHIAYHKGSKVVTALAKYYQQQGIANKVTIIGTLESEEALNIKVTGQYGRRQLADIVLKQRIDVFLFPSICPETFSFVVEEIMQLNMPIVCFDIGAQAEKVGRYDKGKVIPLNCSMAVIHDALCSLAAK